MGILYHDIVIHVSEGRDVILDIIKLTRVESISRRLDQTVKEGRKVQGKYRWAQDPRIFDAEHERPDHPSTMALAEEPAEIFRGRTPKLYCCE